MQIVNISPESTKIWQGHCFGQYVTLIGTHDGILVFQRGIYCQEPLTRPHVAHENAGSWTVVKRCDDFMVEQGEILPELIQCQIGDHPMKRMLFKIGFGSSVWVLWDGYPIIE